MTLTQQYRVPASPEPGPLLLWLLLLLLLLLPVQLRCRRNPGLRAPEPSPELKRRPHQELAAQSMTWGPRPTCQGGWVINEGAKRRDPNRRPRA